jgi:hypothetical protein
MNIKGRAILLFLLQIMKAFFILLFVTVVHCVPKNLDEPWLLFKQVHGKQYNSVEEESSR